LSADAEVEDDDEEEENFFFIQMTQSTRAQLTRARKNSQAEAKAHKVGQKATEHALAAQAKAEQAKIQQRRMRAMADEARQSNANMREQARMTKEIDRSLDTRVMLGQ
jgi:hypothetical protein